MAHNNGASTSSQLIHAETVRERLEVEVEGLSTRIRKAILFMQKDAARFTDEPPEAFKLRMAITAILRGET